MKKTIQFLLATLSLSAPIYAADPLDTPIDQQIPQLLVIGFQNSQTAISHLKKHNIGGVILYNNNRGHSNFSSPEDLSSLTQSLKAARNNIIISIDQEGGKVSHLPPQLFEIPSSPPAYYGKIDSTNFTQLNAAKVSLALQDHGINTNLAPVVDLAISPQNFIANAGRCFHSSPSPVSLHAKAFIKGMHQNNIISCLKHFPGHGSSSDDSHLGFVDISNSWSEVELLPFENLINSGFQDLIMTTHCVNSQLDPSLRPATLSKPILTDLLRNKLNFKGVIITDDLSMRAISDSFSLKGAIINAINAGADLLILANHDPENDQTEQAIQIITDAVLIGDIPTARITEAFNRIQTLKARYNLNPSPLPPQNHASSFNQSKQACPGQESSRGCQILSNKKGYTS